jgi:phospholipase/carboxylesterase
MKHATVTASLVLLAAILAAPPARAEEPETGRREIEAPDFKARYLLDVPANYTGEKEWPLVVGLHGMGDKPENYIRVFEGLAPKRGYLFAAPEGDHETPCMCGQCDDMIRTWSLRSEKYVLWVIENVAKTYRIKKDHVYLTGFSAGAVLTFHIGLRNPDRFTGIVPMAGRVVRGPEPLDLRKARTLPIFGFVGKKDPFYASMVQAMNDLKAKGFLDASLLAKPDIGHTIPLDELPALFDWFDAKYEQRKTRGAELKKSLAVAKEALARKAYGEAVPLLVRVSEKAVTAASLSEAEGLLEKAELEGAGRVWHACEKAAAGDEASALETLRAVQAEFKGLPCAEKAAQEEQALLDEGKEEGGEE